MSKITPYEIGYSDYFKGNACEFDESSIEQSEWWEGYLDAADADAKLLYDLEDTQ